MKKKKNRTRTSCRWFLALFRGPAHGALRGAALPLPRSRRGLAEPDLALALRPVAAARVRASPGRSRGAAVPVGTASALGCGQDAELPARRTHMRWRAFLENSI